MKWIKTVKNEAETEWWLHRGSMVRKFLNQAYGLPGHLQDCMWLYTMFLPLLFPFQTSCIEKGITLPVIKKNKTKHKMPIDVPLSPRCSAVRLRSARRKCLMMQQAQDWMLDFYQIDIIMVLMYGWTMKRFHLDVYKVSANQHKILSFADDLLMCFFFLWSRYSTVFYRACI